MPAGNAHIADSLELFTSTAIANQLPGQLVSTQIRTTGPNCFKFILALIMTSTNIVWKDEWLSDSIPLDHKAWIAGAESTEIPDLDDEWSIQTYIQLACHRPTTL